MLYGLYCTIHIILISQTIYGPYAPKKSTYIKEYGPYSPYNMIFRKNYVEVNVGNIQKSIDEGRIDASNLIDTAVLQSAGLVGKSKDGIRLLGNGEVSAKIKIHVAGASKSAMSAVEKAGGSVLLIASAASE